MREDQAVRAMTQYPEEDAAEATALLLVNDGQ